MIQTLYGNVIYSVIQNGKNSLLVILHSMQDDACHTWGNDRLNGFASLFLMPVIRLL